MDRSLEARREFSASNSRILQAVASLAKDGDAKQLEEVKIVMPVSVYEYLIDKGYYSSITREKKDRRSFDRRTGDRRQSGRR